MAKVYQVILAEFAEERLEQITNYLLENASYDVANKVVNYPTRRINPTPNTISI